jgi:type IV pilus assembly protein PilA
MLSTLKTRLNTRDESGFTLIELLVVLIIIGVLLAIAVPSYLGFKDRAEKNASQANVRAALPSVEAYYSDVGNYTNMTKTTGDAPDTQGLTSIDPGTAAKLSKAEGTGTGATYCVSAKVGNWFASSSGPGGAITVAKTATDPCP